MYRYTAHAFLTGLLTWLLTDCPPEERRFSRLYAPFSEGDLAYRLSVMLDNGEIWRVSRSGWLRNAAISARAAGCFLLSGSLLVGSIAPSVAEAPRLLIPAIPNALAPSDGAPPRSSDNSVLWEIGLAAAGVIGCALLGCFGGDDAPASANSGNNYR